MPDVSQTKLFRDMNPKELQRIGARLKEVTHPAGTEIVTAGSGGIAFLVILDGEAEVHTTDGRTRQLGPGDHFGEIALLRDDTRTATVVARTDLKLAGLTQWDFKPFLLEHPEVAYRMLQGLARLVSESEAASSSSA